MEHKTIDRFRGCLYGQALGDALGLGTEFMTDEDIAWKYPHGLQHYKQIYQDRHRKRWKGGRFGGYWKIIILDNYNAAKD